MVNGLVITTRAGASLTADQNHIILNWANWLRHSTRMSALIRTNVIIRVMDSSRCGALNVATAVTTNTVVYD